MEAKSRAEDAEVLKAKWRRDDEIAAAEADVRLAKSKEVCNRSHHFKPLFSLI